MELLATLFFMLTSISSRISVDCGCLAGYWGLNCSTPCGHCYAHPVVCDQITGFYNVTRCANGYEGRQCIKECDPGSYGGQCSGRCGKCRVPPCNFMSGRCINDECIPWLISPETMFIIFQCDPGSYGGQCSGRCGKCRVTPCNFMSGRCLNDECSPGYQGLYCTEPCSVGLYGYNCLGQCGHCKDNGVCNITNGVCPDGCQNGYQGPTCTGSRVPRIAQRSPLIYIIIAVGCLIGVSMIIVCFIYAVYRNSRAAVKPDTKIKKVHVRVVSPAGDHPLTSLPNTNKSKKGSRSAPNSATKKMSNKAKDIKDAPQQKAGTGMSRSTANSKGNQEAKKEMKCGVCENKFTDPRLLSCLHSFCLNCLRRYVEKGKYKTKFPCPLCNRSIDLPKSGVKALQTNMYLVAAENQDKTPPCDICDAGNKAIERCLDCEENMCQSCLSYHSKMKATRTHRTAPMGEKTKSKPKIQQKQFCDLHEQEELRFFCVPCAKIVCRDCKTLNHTTHHTMEVTEVADGRKREIGKSIRHAKEYLPKISAHIKALNTMLKTVEKNTQETTKEIKAQVKKMHEEIDRMATEMIKDIKQKNSEMETTLQRNMKTAEMAHASIESIILSAESFAFVGSDHDVIENSINIKNRIDNLSKEIPGESVDFEEIKFRPGPIPSRDLFSCFGNWTSEVAAKVAVSIPRQIGPAMTLLVRELNSFSVLGGKAIISIAPTREGTAWICNSLSEHVFQYTKTGQCRSHIKAGFEVGDLYVASDDTIMMSLPAQRKIKRMTQNGNITDFASLPTYPAGIAQTESGDILVCAMEKLGESVRGPESRGSIVRVNNFGRKEQFDKERPDSNLFSRPIRIAVNSNKDVVVSDWTKGNDHVVALSADGKMKWKYFGPKTIELREQFVPNALACDRYGHVLIADSHNQSIHLVDKDGHLIKLLLTEKENIGEPWAVAVDSEGFLWVGNTDGYIKVFKYMS